MDDLAALPRGIAAASGHEAVDQYLRSFRPVEVRLRNRESRLLQQLAGTVELIRGSVLRIESASKFIQERRLEHIIVSKGQAFIDFRNVIRAL